MGLQIAVLTLILFITFVNSIWGAFSGVINAFCCAVSAVVAFAFGDLMLEFLTKTCGMAANYASSASIVLTFFASLVILRLLADNFIRGNVRVPQYVDWGLGGVCGLLIAMFTVGTMVTGFLMLPLGDRVLMFTRYERSKDGNAQYATFKRNTFWIPADDFTAGFASMVSAGSMKGTTKLADVYPNYPDWVFFTGNTVQPESNVTPVRNSEGDGFKEGLKVDTWWEQKDPISDSDARYRKAKATEDNSEPTFERMAYKPESGNKALGFRLTLGSASADLQKGFRVHRFRPSMLRLVGSLGSGDSARPAQYLPRVMRGVYERVGEAYRIVDLDNNLALTDTDAQLDAIYEVPPNFTPRFIEYRRYCRTAIPSDMAKAPPSARLKYYWLAKQEEEKEKELKATGVSTLFNAFDNGASGQRDDFPFACGVDKAKDCVLETIENDVALVSGRISGDLDSLRPADREKLIRLIKKPEGKRLFMLKMQTKKAQSLFGQSIQFVTQRVAQYRIRDNSGEDTFMCGYYAQVRRETGMVGEFVMTQPDTPEGMSFRGQIDLKLIKPDELTHDDAFVLLIFALKPEVKVLELYTGGDGKVDLREAGWETRK